MRLLILIALMSVLWAAADDEHATARSRMAALFKQEFKMDAEAAEKERRRLARAANAGVLMLATVQVRGKSKVNAVKLEEAMTRIEAGKFNWRTGGTIVKGKGGPLSPDLKFKYNPDHNGIDILNFSW